MDCWKKIFTRKRPLYERRSGIVKINSMYWQSDSSTHDESFWIRVISLIFLGWYSIQFFTFDVNQNVMDAFIHGPNLIFHEAGHVLFMPFGEFMTILGWSLFQCMLPMSLMFVFYFRENNFFAALFCLWWTGQNLTDVALYISDASARSLPLIGGMSEEAHDWWNILTMLDLLKYDHTLWLTAHYVGMFFMLSALFLGVRYLVWEYVKKI